VSFVWDTEYIHIYICYVFFVICIYGVTVWNDCATSHKFHWEGLVSVLLISEFCFSASSFKTSTFSSCCTLYSSLVQLVQLQCSAYVLESRKTTFNALLYALNLKNCENNLVLQADYRISYMKWFATDWYVYVQKQVKCTGSDNVKALLCIVILYFKYKSGTDYQHKNVQLWIDMFRCHLKTFLST